MIKKKGGYRQLGAAGVLQTEENLIKGESLGGGGNEAKSSATDS